MFDDSSDSFRKIQMDLSSFGTQWHWNPSPSALYYGRIWEMGVKSTKHHLRRMIGLELLTFSEFTTLLCPVEAYLNLQPLLRLMDSLSENHLSSPAHLLILRPSFLILEQTFPMRRYQLAWQLVSQRVQSS